MTGAAPAGGLTRFSPQEDSGLVDACWELAVAAQPVDDPDGPPLVRSVFTTSPRRADTAGWLAPGAAAGTWSGFLLLDRPLQGNTHRAQVRLVVAPGRRRSGLGRVLLTQALRWAGERGCPLLTGRVREGTAGHAFLTAVGGSPGMVAGRRVLDLTGLPAARRAELRGQAEPAAAGYSLLSWTGATPQQHLAGVALVSMAMEDAPHSPFHRRTPVDAQRIRERDQGAAERGLRSYTVAARCDRTGELAGLSQIVTTPQAPGWGFQETTMVDAAHRGHRLGLLLKVALLDLVTEAEAGVRHILTENAVGNGPMIAINDALGFRVVDQWATCSLDVPPPTASG